MNFSFAVYSVEGSYTTECRSPEVIQFSINFYADDGETEIGMGSSSLDNLVSTI